MKLRLKRTSSLIHRLLSSLLLLKFRRNNAAEQLRIGNAKIGILVTSDEVKWRALNWAQLLSIGSPSSQLFSWQSHYFAVAFFAKAANDANNPPLLTTIYEASTAPVTQTLLQLLAFFAHAVYRYGYGVR